MESKYNITFDGNKKVFAHFRDFTVHTDQPEKFGGENSAPEPFEIFLASIGTCAGFFVASFCQSRSIPTDNMYCSNEFSQRHDAHGGESNS